MLSATVVGIGKLLESARWTPRKRAASRLQPVFSEWKAALQDSFSSLSIAVANVGLFGNSQASNSAGKNKALRPIKGHFMPIIYVITFS